MLLRRSPHSFSRHSLLLLHASALFLLLELAGAQTTTTFDDTDSSFSWYGEWTPVAGDCSWCASKVDPTQTYGGTWHDGNHVVTSSEQTGGSFAFTGTAVSIYGIDQSTNGAAPDIVFTLEGFTSTHHYTGTSNDKVYHSLFFSHSGLANGAHTVNWVLNVDPSTPSSADEVVALFDYAVVTSAVNSDTGGGGGGGGGTTTTTTTGGSGGGGGTGPGTTTTTTGGSGGGGGGGGSTISGTNSLKSSSSSIRSGSSTISQTGTGGPGTIGAVQTPTTSGVPDSNPSSSSPTIISSAKHSSVGTAVGIAIGAIALLVFLVVAFCVWRRRRRAKKARVSAFMVGGRPRDGDAERPPRRQPGLPAVPIDESGGAADNLDLVAVAAAPPVLHSEKDPDQFWAVAASIPQAPRAPIPSHPTPAPAPAQTLSPSSDSPMRFHGPTTRSLNADTLFSPISPSHSLSRSDSLATTRLGSQRTTSTMRERERMLEARVAELEARVAMTLGGVGVVDANGDSQPPPYVRGSGSGSQPAGAGEGQTP